MVIPEEAGIHLKRLDSPVSSTGQAYQVRNDSLYKGISKITTLVDQNKDR